MESGQPLSVSRAAAKQRCPPRPTRWPEENRKDGAPLHPRRPLNEERLVKKRFPDQESFVTVRYRAAAPEILVIATKRAERACDEPVVM